MTIPKESEKNLAKEIHESFSAGIETKTRLETSEKVLARVTDGIYRQPGSALRELISNSYDADADNVLIETDAPRFETITIKDDGNGMSVEALANMLQHIGGSAKRNNNGKMLHVTDGVDSTLSPIKKRKLIGKIGIGLFSVAQLTREFEIITKQEGTDYYIHAKILLHNYSDELLDSAGSDIEKRGATFETGSVTIWKEQTSNIDAHGTDIILQNIKRSSRDQLRSSDIWGQVEDNENDSETVSAVETPEFHIGNAVGDSGQDKYETDLSRPNLPWELDDAEINKLPKLYSAILGLTKNTVSPKLALVLDNYLSMIWTLSLSIPLDYIDQHPFDISSADCSNIYCISNKKRGKAQPVSIPSNTSIGRYLEFLTSTSSVSFNVVIDGIKLYRPIKFRDLPTSGATVKEPIMFVGQYKPDLSKLDLQDSGGGELQFEAYIFWQPKVIPKDHNGVLIRLHNASGILFDETFMKHQVAEHVIKSQLTAEIFVNKGLESALNIDRESFNASHPHYQIIMRWLHQAIRQTVSQYKAIKKDKTSSKRVQEHTKFRSNISKKVDYRLETLGVDPDEKPNLVIEDEDNTEEYENSLLISRREFSKSLGTTRQETEKEVRVKSKAEAIFQLLSAYKLLEEIPPSKQHQLIMDIIDILSEDA